MEVDSISMSFAPPAKNSFKLEAEAVNFPPPSILVDEESSNNNVGVPFVERDSRSFLFAAALISFSVVVVDLLIGVARPHIPVVTVGVDWEAEGLDWLLLSLSPISKLAQD